MKIVKILIGKLTIPLIRPFITAVRRTEHVEDIVVVFKTDTGHTSYGSAAATPAITGDSQESIISALQNWIAPRLINQPINQFNHLLQQVQIALKGNTSAKAAADIALHDLFAQYCHLPLYQFLGGSNNQIDTCITVSAKNIEAMSDDAKLLVSQGFDCLKIKLGLYPEDDINCIAAIRAALGPKIRLLIDANQGWDTKSGLYIIKAIEKYQPELIEQPLKAHDLTNMQFIHERVNSLIVADESCFSANDALSIVKMNACDAINIKLMKSGGIFNANAIYHIATTANMKCMFGCMLESPIGVAAMASYASTRPHLFTDLDPIALIKHNPLIGGATLQGKQITLSDRPGLGIEGFSTGFTLIHEINHAL